MLFTESQITADLGTQICFHVADGNILQQKNIIFKTEMNNFFVFPCFRNILTLCMAT